MTNGDYPAVPGIGLQQQATDPSLAATTTFQDDLVTAGQRKVNIMWEGTQRWIALMVAGVTLVVCTLVVTWGDSSLKAQAFQLLSNTFFLVIGTYFQRTNHTKTGGIGPNASTTR